jgi:predicted patatin/cPLA2 family phospholipase
MIKYILLTLFSIVSSCNVLTLSGGGVYGAYEIGIGSKLFEDGAKYDLITGISAGCINTAYLSTIPSGTEKYYTSEFKSLWASIKNKDIYKNIYFLNGLSLYDTTPLTDTINRIYSTRIPIRPIKIGATSLIDGKTRVFNENDLIKYGYNDIILSSTAIPIVFPPHQFLEDIFIDGGFTSNILLNEGINFCLKNYPKEKIYVDVIVCGHKLNKDIDISMHLKDLLSRIYSVIKQQVQYAELLHPILEDNIYITVYEQKHDDSYSLLDFNATTVLFDEGYRFSNVNVYWLNNTKKEIKINF